jgi:hypothetical protein
MPAVTVSGNLTLPHVDRAEPGTTVRKVRSITDTSSGFGGDGD